MVFVDDDTDYNNISPRLGLAWQVADKTVVRSGWGIFYMPSHVQAAGHSGSAGMMGFNTQPNTQVDAGAFGTVSGAGAARQIQFGLKFIF